MFDTLVEQMKVTEGVTEQLKKENPLEVGRSNEQYPQQSYRNREPRHNLCLNDHGGMGIIFSATNFELHLKFPTNILTIFGLIWYNFKTEIYWEVFANV